MITGDSGDPQMLAERARLRASLGDDFEILEELGRGGMAIVFRAVDKALGRDVAIKVLPAHLMKDAALVERFEHEARTAGNLEHPNIIPIYRVGRAGPNRDVSYFVMKLLRGQSLSGVLRDRGKLPPEELRTLLLETASALGYAARHRVVHRDIKPDNILFDSEGRAILTDFGIAKTPGAHHSAAGTLVGTPRYMSPEHALSQRLDGRSDLYSLGVVAWEALFGAPPFDDKDPLEIIYKHIHEPLSTPPLGTEVERELHRVISRMLAKKPDDRFQTADAVIVALGGEMLPHTSVTETAITAPIATLGAEETAPSVPVVPGVITEPVARRQPAGDAPVAKPRPVPWITIGVLGAAVASVIAIAMFRGRLTRQPPVTPAMETPAPVAQLPAQPERAPVITATIDSSKVPPPVTASAEPAKATPPVTRVVAAPPPPKPSARALAILAYNKLRSGCATRDTAASSAPIEYAVLIDSVSDRPRADSMSVAYDVCGLPRGSSFTASFTLTKLRQRGLRQQKPHEETISETAGSPRSHKSRTLDTREMSPGPYRLELVIIDDKNRALSASREFRITDK